MPLDDLRSFLDKPTLKLPVGGKTYTVQACAADVWLRLQADIDKADDPTVKGLPDMDIFRMCLGEEIFTKLLPLVTGPELRHIGMTAFLWQISGADAAATYWATGGKAPTPGKATPTRTRRTTPTAGASTTRKAASGTGTTTPKKS